MSDDYCCPECGGDTDRGCGAVWHDYKRAQGSWRLRDVFAHGLTPYGRWRYLRLAMDAHDDIYVAWALIIAIGLPVALAIVFIGHRFFVGVFGVAIWFASMLTTTAIFVLSRRCDSGGPSADRGAP